jgi:pantoate--beta-alanine ligase
METAKTIKAVRELVDKARESGKTIGLVPTMGALHAGHMSLIDAAVKRCDYVVVSIFVNPTQFAPGEDFGEYPRDFETDLKKCEQADVNVVFAPTANEMYPRENLSWVSLEKITNNLCGLSRPTFFRGVTTVCTKLFNIVRPDIAFFGQKDAQQAIVIRRMVQDLNMPLVIEVCPTVREKDGLALSSRNQYLTQEQRKEALLINNALTNCQAMVQEGQRNCKALVNEMHDILRRGKHIEIDYIKIVDTETVEDIEQIVRKALVAVAAKVGKTRLIDNIIIDLTK